MTSTSFKSIPEALEAVGKAKGDGGDLVWARGLSSAHNQNSLRHLNLKLESLYEALNVPDPEGRLQKYRQLSAGWEVAGIYCDAWNDLRGGTSLPSTPGDADKLLLKMSATAVATMETWTARYLTADPESTAIRLGEEPGMGTDAIEKWINTVFAKRAGSSAVGHEAESGEAEQAAGRSDESARTNATASLTGGQEGESETRANESDDAGC